MSTPSTSPKDVDSFLELEDQLQGKLEQKTFWKLARRILVHRRLLLAGLVFMLISTAGVLAEPRLLGMAIDDGVVPKDWDRLRWIVGVFLGVEIVRSIAAVAQGYFFTWLGQEVMQDLRLLVFTHLERVPVSVFNRNPVGKLVTRVTNDIAALAEMFSAGLVALLGNFLVVLGIFIGLLWMDFKLGLVAVSVLPPLVALSVRFSRMLRVAYREARTKLSALNAYLAENLLGMKVVQLYCREKTHWERYSRLNRMYCDAQISSVRAYAFFQPMITLFSGLAMALVIGVGGGMAREGTVKLGVLVAFFSYVLQFFQPLREIADKWNILLSGMASAERLFSLLEWKPELTPEQIQKEVQPRRELQGHIVFEQVWFAYEGEAGAEKWILRDFSLEIKPGMKVGVVGHTGAGKSTLIQLLLRFYDPQKGRILLDGKDLREYDLRELRASMGFVQQDVFIFSGSIAENVTLWDSHGPELRGLDLSQIRMEEEILERGANLSMGQRQLLSFARVAHRDPPVWLLDEATANIDTELEKELQDLVGQVAHKRTVITIAHRLATIRDADLIFVLNHGVLVEQGTHRELLDRNGLYARLYRYQDVVLDSSDHQVWRRLPS